MLRFVVRRLIDIILYHDGFVILCFVLSRVIRLPFWWMAMTSETSLRKVYTQLWVLSRRTPSSSTKPLLTTSLTVRRVPTAASTTGWKRNMITTTSTQHCPRRWTTLFGSPRKPKFMCVVLFCSRLWKHCVSCCSCSLAQDQIQAMRDQYDTVVGERGLKLSGGEKQRVVRPCDRVCRRGHLVLTRTLIATQGYRENHFQKRSHSLL